MATNKSFILAGTLPLNDHDLIPSTSPSDRARLSQSWMIMSGSPRVMCTIPERGFSDRFTRTPPHLAQRPFHRPGIVKPETFKQSPIGAQHHLDSAIANQKAECRL